MFYLLLCYEGGLEYLDLISVDHSCLLCIRLDTVCQILLTKRCRICGFILLGSTIEPDRDLLTELGIDIFERSLLGFWEKEVDHWEESADAGKGKIFSSLPGINAADQQMITR